MTIIPFPTRKDPNLPRELVTLEGFIVREWAVEISFALDEYADAVLIPKSEIVLQVERPELGPNGVCIEIRLSLAEKEGLV